MEILLTMLALASQAAEPPRLVEGTPELPRHVSIIQLIATPEKYHGESVLVKGFARVEFEGNMLCLSREDAERWQTKNCIWLELDYRQRYGQKEPIQRSTMKHVTVVGVFDKNDTGHMGCCSGQIKNVVRVFVAGGG